MHDKGTGISYEILRTEDTSAEHHRTEHFLTEGFFYFRGKAFGKLLFERRIDFFALLQVINKFGDSWVIVEA
jgi:hypothetical protein